MRTNTGNTSSNCNCCDLFQCMFVFLYCLGLILTISFFYEMIDDFTMVSLISTYIFGILHANNICCHYWQSNFQIIACLIVIIGMNLFTIVIPNELYKYYKIGNILFLAIISFMVSSSLESIFDLRNIGICEIKELNSSFSTPGKGITPSEPKTPIDKKSDDGDESQSVTDSKQSSPSKNSRE